MEHAYTVGGTSPGAGEKIGMTTNAGREPHTGLPGVAATKLRGILDQANSNALRLALYQNTGDPELAAMRLSATPIRGGALMMKTVADDDLPLLKEKALHFLEGPRQTPPPAPDDAEARRLLKIFTGGEQSESYLRFGVEELAFSEFPRDLSWIDRPPRETLDKVHVLVIGGGISGIATAIQLQRVGLDYTVIERQAEIGGTWQLNRYPEARVDTSSYTYQFKFEKNYRWSEYFASRDETKRYLDFVAQKHGILDHFVFDTEVIAAEWDEERAGWAVITRHRDGREEHRFANFIVSASGLFATPNLPDIPGIEDYRGRIFHSTQWDLKYDYHGKRIALIGTGSTGTQMMPALARAASHLTVFQRSPNWISGVDGYRAKVPEETQYLFDNLPYYWNWFCYSGFDTALQLQNAQTYDHDWIARTGGAVSEANERLRGVLTEYMKEQLQRRGDLIEKCMPDHAPLGRRLVVDNGFYAALLRTNVLLQTSGIDHFTANGIVACDGTESDFDLVVLAAGFKVAKYLFPIDYKGRDGATLEGAWAKDGARSYLGAAMPGFPNLFMIYGPQGQPRSGGFYSWAEIWSRYAVGMIVRTLEQGSRSAEVRRDVFDRYNGQLDEAMREILWEKEGAGSYFNNEFGRSQVNIPFRTEEYHAMVAKPDLDAYALRG